MADGVYLRTRLDGKQCILVLVGADDTSKKQVLALHCGLRESKLSWCDVLRDLKRGGLTCDIELAVGDGALSLWAAMLEEYPDAKHQRCWLHKTMNVLNKLPKPLQSQAKSHLHKIWMADTRDNALKAFDDFIHIYNGKYPQAADCLMKDKTVCNH